MRDLFRAFRQRPLRLSLLLLQLFFSALIMTLSLTAALASRSPRLATERFNVIAGSEDANFVQTNAIFQAADVPELSALSPNVLRFGVLGELWEPNVILNGTRYAIRSGAQVSAGYFDIEPPDLVSGTLFTTEEIAQGDTVALLSDQAAKAVFGSADPIGKILLLLKQQFDPEAEAAPPTGYRIVGTFRSEPGDPSNEKPALYIPYPSDPAAVVEAASTLAVQAKPGAGEAARTEVLNVVRAHYADDLEAQNIELGKDFMIKAPDEDYFDTEVDRDVLVFSLFGVVALVVSAIGIFSTTLVEVEARAHEIGIRRALGASTSMMVRRLLGHTLVTALVGTSAGIVTAALLLPRFREPALRVGLFGGTPLTFNPLAAVLVLGAVVLVSSVLGFVPALRVSRLKPVQALHEGV